MRYSLNRLQSYIQEPLPEAEVLKEKIIFSAFEVESVEEIESDTVFDIKVLPDRASDCFSHRGMARELARICGFIVKKTEKKEYTSEKSESVTIASEAVRAYTLIRMRTETQKESPFWMKDYLAAVGQRSISLFVDIANMVMFDLGQPVHIFDAKKVVGSIAVRESKEGESITLLSGETMTLPGGVCVIADDEGVLAIAGIKGGARAEVDENTQEILVEVANFDPVRIRKTARMLRLQTDASKRFENEVPLSYTIDARSETISRIIELVGGEVCAEFEYQKEIHATREISFTSGELAQILGAWITDARVKEILVRTGWEYTETADFYTVLVPEDRPDMAGVHDIAEDIGKLAGYEYAGSIETLPFVSPVEHNESYIHSQSIRAHFIEKGYSEVYTYSFTKKGKVEIAYGPKDKSALRTNLLDGLTVAYEKNKINAALLMTDSVCIFEIGTVFLGEPDDTASAEGFGVSKEELRVAWKSEKESGEMMLADFVQKESLSGNTLSIPDIDHREPFKDWSVYPFIIRDVAVWVNEAGKEVELETIVEHFAKAYCVLPPRVFDRFEKPASLADGDGKVSVAYRFVFQSHERTLTHEEVEGYMVHLFNSLDPEVFTLR